MLRAFPFQIPMNILKSLMQFNLLLSPLPEGLLKSLTRTNLPLNLLPEGFLKSLSLYAKLHNSLFSIQAIYPLTCN